jgi:dUTP pyrophosphatase
MPEIPINGTVEPGAVLPSYETSGSAGADLRARLESPIILEPGARALVPTGIRLEIPPGYEGQVRPRSGLAIRNGVTVLNAPGTIDSDYRGEVLVILINHGDAPFAIHGGERIAQLVVAPVTKAVFRETTALEASDRGDGGFGSTGV